MIIWYCNHYSGGPNYGNKSYHRPYLMALQWSKLGHKSIIITSSYEHSNGLKSDSADPVAFSVCNNVDFAFIKTPVYSGNGLPRFWNMLSFGLGLRKNFKKISKKFGKPDVIVCSVQHPFHFNVCLRIAKKYKIKLIAEVRDLWPLSLIEIAGVSKFHPVVLWLSRIEKKICRHSDVLVSLLNDSKPHFVSKGLSPDKFYCIPNGYSPESLPFVEPLDDCDYQVLKNTHVSGKFIIGYTGSCGEPNHLEILCQAVSELNNDNICLFIIGEGDKKAYFQNKYASFANIYFFGYKPRVGISSFQNLFHVAYMGAHECSFYRFGLSFNKMYEYLYNKTPVLTGVFPENTPVQHSNAGFYFKNESVGSLKKEIMKAYHTQKSELIEMGKRGHHEVETNYLYSSLAKKYLDIIIS